MLAERVGFPPVAALPIRPGQEIASIGRIFFFRPFESELIIRLYKINHYCDFFSYRWRREWDSNPRQGISLNTISSRAPSTSSTISPYKGYYTLFFLQFQWKLSYEIFFITFYFIVKDSKASPI